MKKKFTLLCMLAAAAALALSALSAQGQKLRVAVFDPTSSGAAVDEGTKVAVREIISSTFVNTGKYTIVERSLLDKVMKEQAFSNSDVVDESQATELGRLAGANKVVLSVVTLVSGRNMLSVKIIDVQTATVDQQKTKIVSSSDLLDVVEPLTLELMGEEATKAAPGGAQVSSTPLAAAQIKVASQATSCGCEVQAKDAMQNLSVYSVNDKLGQMHKAAKKAGDIVTPIELWPKALSSFCPEGWRVPTFTELQCMYQEKGKIGGFDNGECYYSSKINTRIWYKSVSIDFDTGKEKNMKAAGGNLRCVRDND
ncbi:MAG: CsgG/HfaB family protein [Prevotellaceae bacterium]|jgi:hypothetical protein|nr:CsgG/HfaB family protein [Prevotellaceae bacterium]